MVAEEKSSTRKSHRKSRQGCHNCKRRKVKCGEEKPTCVNCVRFSLSCEYGPTRSNAAPPRPPPPAATCTGDTRRGRGRPRKDWAALYAGTQIAAPDPDKPVYCRDGQPGDYSINITHTELLHHFITQTAPTLSSSGNVDPMRLFWTDNVPKIGLAHPVILSLLFSLSAFHLAYLHRHADSAHHYYRTTAEHYLGDGLRGMNRLMQTLNATTCGPAYVCATLVCYCTFAAGPTGPHDLLVVNNNPEEEANGAEPTPLTRWVPLVHGVRLIRESFDEEVLFSGLMAPLSPGRPGQPSREATAPSSSQRDGTMNDIDDGNHATKPGSNHDNTNNNNNNNNNNPSNGGAKEEEDDSTPLAETATIKATAPTEPSMYQENYPGLDWEGPVGELERHLLQKIKSLSSSCSSTSSPLSSSSSPSPSSSSLPPLSSPATLTPLPYPPPLPHPHTSPSSLASSSSSSATTYKNTLRELRHLISILEATYGRDKGKTWTNVHPDNRFIFGWLYRMDAGYVECLRRRSPPEALLCLGFYAVLLWVMERDGKHWFMVGWAGQVLKGVRRGLVFSSSSSSPYSRDRGNDMMMMEEKMEEWLRWVEGVVVVDDDDDDDYNARGLGGGNEGNMGEVEMGGMS